MFNLPGWSPCPVCGTKLQIEVFPALVRPVAQGTAAELQLEDEGTVCFFHPQKKAIVPCDGCGRFLCALCDCELNGEHLCPACLESGKKKGQVTALENKRTCYDSMALTLAIVGLLILSISFITAPIALFIAIRHWNSPTSIVRRGKARLRWAVTLASLEIIVLITLFITVFK